MHTALAPGGTLSLLVAGRLAVVLRQGRRGDIPAATAVLTSTDGRWGAADPLPRRFDTDTVLALLRRRSFTADRVHGVRLFSDLVPATVVDNAADRAALLALEEAASSHRTMRCSASSARGCTSWRRASEGLGPGEHR